MNYEKKYKEALSRDRQFSEHPLQEDSDSIVEYIFHELKESEDERIRKEIISHLQHECVVKRNVSDVEYDRWIAWLEKQGEKKNRKASYTAIAETGNGGINALITRDIEIPFGAKDSELQEATYYIPKGYHVKIEGNKVVYEQKSQRMISAEAKEAMYDKPAWSEEDEDFMYDTLSNLTELKDRYGEGYGNVGKCIDWLKSLKQRIGG